VRNIAGLYVPVSVEQRGYLVHFVRYPTPTRPEAPLESHGAGWSDLLHATPSNSMPTPKPDEAVIHSFLLTYTECSIETDTYTLTASCADLHVLACLVAQELQGYALPEQVGRRAGGFPKRLLGFSVCES
jgi:hypothetical protein